MCNSWESDEYANKLEGRKVILGGEGEAFQFTTRDGETTEKTLLEDLQSTQEETDTRVIMYALYGKEQGPFHKRSYDNFY
ncbi:hypothetical protein DPMN_110474 [Dreissena polymorpha]|uniref:Uncharacterized protein n=1 Tax=Dreissena polymorpha TaxID=45954 RepID=A0A9D4KCG0_DREPO|nr:hypothetical protein DPMN_110474 [Dreissena polymorpha]